MPKMIITTVTCQQCGRLFTAGKYTRFCPDCRKIRAVAHHRGVCRRRKQRFRREIGGVYACIDCGAEYVLTSGLQVSARLANAHQSRLLYSTTPRCAHAVAGVFTIRAKPRTTAHWNVGTM